MAICWHECSYPTFISTLCKRMLYSVNSGQFSGQGSFIITPSTWRNNWFLWMKYGDTPKSGKCNRRRDVRVAMVYTDFDLAGSAIRTLMTPNETKISSQNERTEPTSKDLPPYRQVSLEYLG